MSKVEIKDNKCPIKIQSTCCLSFRKKKADTNIVGNQLYKKTLHTIEKNNSQ